jgi:hypothetical protein
MYKIRLLDNNGYTAMYINGKLFDYGAFVKADWVIKQLDKLGLIKDLSKYNWIFDDYYHSPHATDIDEYFTGDDFIEEVDIRSFVFTDDDSNFCPCALYDNDGKIMPNTFDEVCEYLLNKYVYKEEEKEEILEYIS